MAGEVRIRRPTIADGAAMWKLAAAAGELDVNSSYAYLLWCRDFAETSVVAVANTDELAGFITGYRRPDDPDVLMVWQVAVADSFRRQGLAGRMLDVLAGVLRDFGGSFVETTVTPDNAPSRAMFASFAARWQAELGEADLFVGADFPDGHEPERVLRMGPFN